MALPRLLQFCFDSTVTYGEDGYSTLSVRGILEIPLTRDPKQSTRTFTQTADDLRGEIERRAMSGIDLTRFRMVRRNFVLSKDKRVLTWDFQAEEKPYMDLPPGCTVARGSYSVRPATAGMGLCKWLCSLRCSYTVQLSNDAPRRIAWFAFLALLRLRMLHAEFMTHVSKPDEAPAPKPAGGPSLRNTILAYGLGGPLVGGLLDLYRYMNSRVPEKKVDNQSRPFLIDFSFDEGLYLDSKTVSFSATWRLTGTLSGILVGSGLWSRVEQDNKTLWAGRISNVSGAQSWLPNKAKPDIIVDFSGGQ